MKTKEAMITFAIKPIFDRIATSPMETIFATFHVVAHELSHVLAIRKYGRDGIGHGFFWKRIMEDTFQLEGYEIHKTNQVYVQLPDIIHKKERLNDIQNLYQTWRLEEPNWKDPLIKKIIKGQYH
jgi:hypothetical protein